LVYEKYFDQWPIIFQLRLKRIYPGRPGVFRFRFSDLALQHTATEGLGEISRFRKFQGRSAGLLRSENRPSAPPGTFPARGGALRYQLTRLWASMKFAVQNLKAVAMGMATAIALSRSNKRYPATVQAPANYTGPVSCVVVSTAEAYCAVVQLRCTCIKIIIYGHQLPNDRHACIIIEARL
jgi:hypothetical protein